MNSAILHNKALIVLLSSFLQVKGKINGDAKVGKEDFSVDFKIEHRDSDYLITNKTTKQKYIVKKTPRNILAQEKGKPNFIEVKKDHTISAFDYPKKMLFEIKQDKRKNIELTESFSDKKENFVLASI